MSIIEFPSGFIRGSAAFVTDPWLLPYIWATLAQRKTTHPKTHNEVRNPHRGGGQRSPLRVCTGIRMAAVCPDPIVPRSPAQCTNRGVGVVAKDGVDPQPAFRGTIAQRSMTVSRRYRMGGVNT